MFPTPLNSEACWYELAYFAERAGVSIEHICATVEAATQVARESTSAHKGGAYSPAPPYESDLDAVIHTLLDDDDFDLEIKDISWEESKHPRDDWGRFTNGLSRLYRGALADASITYGEIISPVVSAAQYAPPYREMMADEAREELIKLGEKLEESRRRWAAQNRLSDRQLIGARKRLAYLAKQATPSEHHMIQVGEELRRLRPLEIAQRRDIAALRQLLYVNSPAELNIRFDAIPGENMPPITSKRVKKAVNSGAEELRRLVSDKLILGDMYFEREIRPDTRSNYGGARRIKLTEEAGTRMVVHEFGHGLEDLNPTVRRKVLDFRERRTRNEKLLRLDRVNPSYKPHEMYKKDQFINSYMGKFYIGSNSTEILSMGLEYFHSDPLTLARGDKDYFDFIYNLVRGK